jgi:hypothetical protein
METSKRLLMVAEFATTFGNRALAAEQPAGDAANYSAMDLPK